LWRCRPGKSCRAGAGTAAPARGPPRDTRLAAIYSRPCIDQGDRSFINRGAERRPASRLSYSGFSVRLLAANLRNSLGPPPWV
jgi:hypothetical protein